MTDFQNNPPLVIVVAMSRHSRAIGKDNKLLWHIPADLKRFKSLTLGHPIIMGRKTFVSIIDMLGKPLPDRKNIVLTYDHSFEYKDISVAHSLPEALEMAKSDNPTEIHLGGGATLYQEALPLVSKLHVTWVDDEVDSDTFFPDFLDDFEIIKEYPREQYQRLTYQWVDYERKS